MNFTYKNRQRITQKEKDANDKKWYKEQADLLDKNSFSGSSFIGFGGVSEYKRKKVNYDLFNNIINPRDFEYVCQPFGAEGGELPATLTNRDIVSGKLKVLLGMEMKMPFSWKVIAVNEEATTRREQEEFNQVREFVTNEIMRPIQIQIQQELAEQTKGRELSAEEKAQIQQQIAEQTQARTPEEVRRYMSREHQDPAELLAHQLLEYLLVKEKVAQKFNKGWKHSLLSGEEIYWIGIVNGEPCLRVVNPLYFDYDKSPDVDEIENGEWAICEYRMTPSEIVSIFGSELTEEEIDDIYDGIEGSHIYDEDFTFDTDRADESYTISVKHFNWKSLRKVGFLTYLDDNEEEQMKVVDEDYKLKKSIGDISIEWEWIPETHEVYKIKNRIYVYGRPVPGQHRDLDNIYDSKLSYIGAATDSLNSPTTSPMDRIKAYQYYYTIILYRIELLMASDKGKILAANINAIPKSAGIDINQFMYFMEANKIAWFNPTEEGNRNMGDVTNLVKEIDMSLVSDIFKYIEIAKYIEKKCGDAIGITPQMEAQIGPNDAVANTRQSLVQSSHIIQPYFELHNSVKGSALTTLLETAKVAYSINKPKKLSYVLDDMSVRMLSIDQDLLSNSTYGIFVSNSSKAADAKQAVESLAQAALQNQQADLSDIIKIIRSESVTEAEELLEAAQSRKAEQLQDVEKQRAQAQKEADMRLDSREEKNHERQKEIVMLKEEERRKTEIQKQAMFSLGFDPNKDQDEDGTPDVMEVAKFGVDADIKRRKLALDEQKFQHAQEVDKKKLELDKQKIQAQKQKNNN